MHLTPSTLYSDIFLWSCECDDATENVTLQMRLHVFCGVVAYAASGEYVIVQGWRG